MTSQDKLRLASRRNFAKLLGLGAAASAIPLPTTTRAEADDAELDALARLATDGCAVRLGAAELAGLKEGIGDNLKMAAAMRGVPLDIDVQPATPFHPK
jgi:hypothetical protein